MVQTRGMQINLSSFSASSGVGISENISKNTFNVYPNPSSGLVTVSSDENLDKIEVLNIHGQKVYSREASERNIKFDLSHLQKGIYFIRSGDHVEQLIIR